jgi:hypothetical protein
MDAFGSMMDDTGDAGDTADDAASAPAATTANGENPSANGTNATSNGSGDAGAMEGLAALAGLDDAPEDTADDPASESPAASERQGQAAADEPSSPRAAADGGLTVGSFSSEVSEFEAGPHAPSTEAESRARTGSSSGRPAAVEGIASAIENLDAAALEMATVYREGEPATPEDVYTEAAGRVDRVEAYAQNRTLRRAGLIQHVGRGHYDYCLRESLDGALADGERENMPDVYARDLEQEYLD